MQSQRRRRGFSLIYGAILGLALIAVMGLALDTAWVVNCSHQLQNAADAAALAGAFKVRTSQAAAQTIAQSTALGNKCAQSTVVLAANPSNDAAGDVVVGHYYRPGDDPSKLGFYVGQTPLNSVKVTARRTAANTRGPVALFFGPMFQVNTCDVTRTATAMIGGTIPAGVVVLNPHASGSMDLTGKGSRPKMIVNDANNPGTFSAAIIDSDSANAMSWTSANAIVQASDLYISGNEPSAQGLVPNGTVHVNSPPVADPLANVPAPAKPANNGTQVGGVWQAGYYKNGLSGTLGPGIFWVDGGVSGQITATQGTMIYVNTGAMSFQGNKGMTINPPTSGTYKGISVFMARNNASGMSMQGTPDINNTGVLYVPDGNVSIAGNPTAVGSMLVCDTISIQGNGTCVINYNGVFPSEGSKIFLVQ